MRKFTKEQRKIWRNKLKDELERLSSLEEQRHEWLYNTNKTWWFWDELVCCYFDDLSFVEDYNDEGIDFHIGMDNLTAEEANIIRPFNKAFDAYIDKAGDVITIEDHKKILNDPEWIKITEMAKEILEKIDFDKLPEEQD